MRRDSLDRNLTGSCDTPARQPSPVEARMDRFAKPTLITLVAASLALACGSIMHGSAQDVSIASQPSGASVSVDNQTLGTTPVVTKLKRKDKHTIVVKMD